MIMHTFDEKAAAIARALADSCLDRLAMHAPLDHGATEAELDAAAGQTITPGGIGGEAALRIWTDVLAPACLSTDHPRYLSFIPNAPTKAATYFDMLVAASNVYAGSWLEGSGAVYAENQALRWLADLAGLPSTAGGVFVQGGTVGNLSALVAAREAALRTRGGRPARWAVCVTEETHASVKHALRVVMDVDVVEVQPAPRTRKPCLVDGFLRRENQPAPRNVGHRDLQFFQVFAFDRSADDRQHVDGQRRGLVRPVQEDGERGQHHEGAVAERGADHGVEHG